MSTPTPETPTLSAAEWTLLAEECVERADSVEALAKAQGFPESYYVIEQRRFAHACRTMATLASAPADAVTVEDRITAYLSLGGLFNPEAMDHDKVRDLLIACREEALAARRHRAWLDSDAAVECAAKALYMRDGSDSASPTKVEMAEVRAVLAAWRQGAATTDTEG